MCLMWLVTSVCLYIYMSLVYERVLEKCYWGTRKSWKSCGNFSEQKSGNPVAEKPSTFGGLKFDPSYLQNHYCTYFNTIGTERQMH